MTLEFVPLLETSTMSMSLDGFIINSNLRFIKKIGAGTYGLIYLVEDIFTGKRYAAKMILQENTSEHTGKAVPNAEDNKKMLQSKIFNYFYGKKYVGARDIELDTIMSDGLKCPFLREIALHLKVHDHINVTTIHKVLHLEGLAIVILMDYMDQGDLFSNIIDNQLFVNHSSSPAENMLLMKNVILQLIDVIQYCHERGIYHCDLKPENIMIQYNKNYRRNSSTNSWNQGKDWHPSNYASSPENMHIESQNNFAPKNSIIDYNEIKIVLIDFGLAMNTNRICCNACRGSSFYMAPERITNYNTSATIKSLIDVNQFDSFGPHSSNSLYLPTLAGDIWSLGVLFLNITCSRNPWPIASISESNASDVFVSYMLKNNKDILKTILPISTQFNRLLDKIFQLNPNNRISLPELEKEIIECDFFNDYPIPAKVPVKYTHQLFTPPETEKGSLQSEISDLQGDDVIFDSYSYDNYGNKEDYLHTPNNSFIFLEQCAKQVKNHNCPHHY